MPQKSKSPYNSVSDPTPYDLLWKAAEDKYQLPPGLLKAMAWQESNFNPHVDAGAKAGKGLMQFVNSTARVYGIDPFNPTQAIDAAGAYMQSNLAAFKGDVRGAVQAYNMGVGGAKRFFGGDNSVLGDKNFSNSVFKHLRNLTGARMVSKGTPYLVSDRGPQLPATRGAVNDGEAFDAMQLANSAPLESTNFADQRAPGQKNWMEDAGEIGMVAKLTKAFDVLGSNTDADNNSTQRLEAMLDPA